MPLTSKPKGADVGSWRRAEACSMSLMCALAVVRGCRGMRQSVQLLPHMMSIRSYTSPVIIFRPQGRHSSTVAFGDVTE